MRCFENAGARIQDSGHLWRGNQRSANRKEGTMWRYAVVLLICCNLKVSSAQSKVVPDQPVSSCRIEATNYKGWSAQQISNRWLKLIVVPQNGGRLMQVIFAGHSYLFVN